MQTGNDDLEREIINYWNARSEGFNVATNMLLDDRSATRYYLNFLTAGGGGKAVDMCTGCGYLAIELARLGYETVGVDLSKDMLEEAKKNAKKYDVDVTFINGDVTTVDLKERSFDLVTVKDGLWNLTDPEKAYAHWLKLLKPGGRIIIFDANYYSYIGSEDYRKRKDHFDSLYGVDSDLHGKTNVNNVDLTIIDRLAEDLPLSYRIRPAWDVDILMKYGSTNIAIYSLDRERFFVKSGDLEADTPYSFVICAQTPVNQREENESQIGLVELRKIVNQKSSSTEGLLKILSNDNCVKILYALCESQLSVTDISELLGISVSLASHNVNLMKNNGLVKNTRNGKYLYYSLKDPTTVRNLLENCSILVNSD